MRTYRDVIVEHAALQNIVADLEKALRELRDNRQDWERGVDNDCRPSIKMLYGSLKNHRIKLEAFMKVEIYNHPGEVLNGL